MTDQEMIEWIKTHPKEEVETLLEKAMELAFKDLGLED
jgi:hypothetical protein